jgi:Ferric iron reductase FhuF-like transporter
MTWRWQLARHLDAMGPMTRGRYLPDPDLAPEPVPGECFLDAEFLRAAIARAQPTQDDVDPRIGVSRMSRQYCAALTCVALVGLAHGVGIDLSPGRFAMVFRDNLPSRITLRRGYRARHVLRCSERPTRLPVTGPAVATIEELREHVWTNLYARNLARVFATSVSMVNVPERLLWTNAAEWVGVVMDAAVENLPAPLAGPIVTECHALLDARTLPGLGGNPMRGLVEWFAFDDEKHGIQTRNLCCLTYLHSDRKDRLCSNCPILPLPDRAALVRKRRGFGMVQPRIPADDQFTVIPTSSP